MRNCGIWYVNRDPREFLQYPESVYVFLLHIVHLYWIASSIIWKCWISFNLLLYPKVLEGRSYRLQHPWVGIVNRSQADINRNIDMIVARRKEREYFATSPDYGHLAGKMGSEYLAKLLSKVLFLSIFWFKMAFWKLKYNIWISFWWGTLFLALGICN